MTESLVPIPLPLFPIRSPKLLIPLSAKDERRRRQRISVHHATRTQYP